MHRKFIAAIVAVSVAITALSASSAVAGNKDLSRFLAGIAGLAIIGAVIHDQNKRKKTARHVARSAHNPVPHHDARPRHQPKPKPLPSRVARKLLPAQCLRDFETRHGDVRMFGNRCLNNNFKYVDQLPQYCFREVRTPQGLRRGYGDYCLRNKGYSLARN